MDNDVILGVTTNGEGSSSGLFRCGSPSSSSGGGELTETVLWTNPSPTASFAAQTIILSNNIANFDQIKIYWRYSTSNSTEYQTSFSKDFIAASNSDSLRIAFGGARTGGYTYARNFVRSSDTQLYFYASYAINNTVSGNNTIIPTKIVGIN